VHWKFKAECWRFSGLLNQSATSGEVVPNCSVTREKSALSYSTLVNFYPSLFWASKVAIAFLSPTYAAAAAIAMVSGEKHLNP